MKHAAQMAAALVLAASPGLGLADTKWEEDALVVNRLSASDFEVIEAQDMSGRAFWCGAATYVERRQGQSPATPIYLKRARGPAQSAGGRNGVVFTTDPAGLGPVSAPASPNVRQVGQVLKSYQARGFCRDAFTRATK